MGGTKESIWEGEKRSRQKGYYAVLKSLRGKYYMGARSRKGKSMEKEKS